MRPRPGWRRRRALPASGPGSVPLRARSWRRPRPGADDDHDDMAAAERVVARRGQGRPAPKRRAAPTARRGRGRSPWPWGALRRRGIPIAPPSRPRSARDRARSRGRRRARRHRAARRSVPPRLLGSTAPGPRRPGTGSAGRDDRCGRGRTARGRGCSPRAAGTRRGPLSSRQAVGERRARDHGEEQQQWRDREQRHPLRQARRRGTGEAAGSGARRAGRRAATSEWESVRRIDPVLDQIEPALAGEQVADLDQPHVIVAVAEPQLPALWPCCRKIRIAASGNTAATAAATRSVGKYDTPSAYLPGVGFRTVPPLVVASTIAWQCVAPWVSVG